MLRRKLYTTKSTPLQAQTAIVWDLGSAILGTLTAKEMTAKERIPSDRSSKVSDCEEADEQRAHKNLHKAARICVSKPYWF